MNKIKNNHIAIFIPSMRGGGAERVILNLIKGLVVKEYKIDLLLSNAEGPFLKDVPDTVKIIDLKSNGVIKSLPKLVKYLRSSKPNILLSAMYHTNIISIVAKLMTRTDTKFIISDHSTLSTRINNNKNVKEYLLLAGVKILYKYADKIIVVSKGAAEDLKEILHIDTKKISVIYNPIIEKKLYEKVKFDVIHSYFDQDLKVVISVGRLTKQKDFSTLLKAFKIVKDRINTKLIILGEGDDRNRLEEEILTLGLEGDVDLVGFVENPYAYMNRSNLFVLSSQREGFGNVLVEALAVGLPVVSTDCKSGPREILEDGKYGTLVPVGDENKLASAIIENLVSDDFQYQRVNLDKFSIENITQEYIEAFEAIK